MNAAKDRYLALIAATLRHALAHRPPIAADGGLTMELALPALSRRLGLEPRDDAALALAIERVDQAPTTERVVDGAGQTRSMYRPLLMRSLAPFEPREPSGAFKADGVAAIERVERFASAGGPILTVDGAEVMARSFDAMTIVQPRPDSATRGETAAAALFERLLDAQSAEGRFLQSTSADQLEPAWYHELAVLHAVALFATHLERAAPSRPLTRDVRQAVRRSARYHAEQVQPDHASSHPFGLAALLDDAEGIHLADMMLHAAGVQQPATMDAVSLVLLFDALDCGRTAEPA